MKLLFLSIGTFIFIATSTLVIGSIVLENDKSESLNKQKVFSEESYPTAPVLKKEVKLPEITAYSVFAMDINSGVSLVEINPDEPTLPASTTKIITALTALDYYPLDKNLRVGNISVQGQKMKLLPGEEISVQNLLEGLLIYSANDAAEVLAENYPGGRQNFISAMNLKTKELGLNNSHFYNPTGLDGVGHQSTARDLVFASYNAMKIPFFSETVAKKETSISSIDGKVVHNLKNINELLGEVDGVLGIKTGWTENAKENLVTYVDRNGNKVLIALLGSSDRFGETKVLINWIYDNYEWRQNPQNLQHQFSLAP
ncbi:MAG: hypothetical protein US53_C0063G0005 [Candidatus Woesebacteria bacterium GW2011_GWA1_37_7]|uniref:Peptidase S11 D-alanyl-D-alanine carboxypeptidase A N-terminal domain-containing protein n=1 Tax=Candidatus Woesebacteria bacterium GW2011_GWA1_37_7 TaxID=1618545 RepID=A0A0G0GYY0_9BACT|nr:MAG: hypothetical protein US53_C0063G0005 [Candidatus Woesebacteria bacterium GW2011_GWA1_37_7]